MNNINTIRDSIAGFDLTTLSAQNQQQAFAMLKNVASLIFSDTLENASSPDTITNIFTAITTAQVASKVNQVTAL